MKIEFSITGLDGVLDTLRSLPAEVVSKRGGPVRAALRKGALVIHRQELANLAAVTAHSADADKRQSTGFLAKNVVVTRGKAPTGSNGERFIVRVKRKGYPDRKGARVSTLKTAQLLEYGSSKQPAEPWIRPAFESRKQEALDTVQRELLGSIERIVKKLARQNAGK